MDLYSYNEPLMHFSWGYHLNDTKGLGDFVAQVSDQHVAIMFHSKDRVPVEDYQAYVRDLWSASD
jgi:hypothetical protein